MSNLSEKYTRNNENKPCLRTFRTDLVYRASPFFFFFFFFCLFFFRFSARRQFSHTDVALKVHSFYCYIYFKTLGVCLCLVNTTFVISSRSVKQLLGRLITAYLFTFYRSSISG